MTTLAKVRAMARSDRVQVSDIVDFLLTREEGFLLSPILLSVVLGWRGSRDELVRCINDAVELSMECRISKRVPKPPTTGNSDYAYHYFLRSRDLSRKGSATLMGSLLSFALSQPGVRVAADYSFVEYDRGNGVTGREWVVQEDEQNRETVPLVDSILADTPREDWVSLQ